MGPPPLPPSTGRPPADGQAPLPLVLFLEPTTDDPVWDGIVARASATIQTPGFSRTLDGAGARASLEQALAQEPVRFVVVGGEGDGPPLGRSSLGLRTRAVATALRVLPVARRRPGLAVVALWFDTGQRRFLAFVLDPGTDTFTPCAVEAVLPGVATVLEGAVVAAAS